MANDKQDSVVENDTKRLSFLV